MVVENFRDGCYDAVYDRFKTSGRMLPDGLNYLNSWSNENKNICFQLMESRDEALFKIWFQRWSDLVEFDVYPVDGS